MFKFRGIREYANLHILLWLIKDTFWVMDWEIIGLIMIIPTIGVAIYITWLRRKVRTEVFHNIAVCLWITGNCIWMIGEFYYDDGLRPVTALFFMVGLLILIYYYFVEKAVLKRSSKN